MFLSRLVLNPRSRRAQQERADVYQLHRTIMRAFPETLPEDERVLFRREDDRQTGALLVLVQSCYEPDWGWLEDEPTGTYLLPLAEPNPWTKCFDPVFTAGQQFVFRLRGNPTVKRDGKRLGLIREEDQLNWLIRKAEAGGFAVLSATVQAQGFIQGTTQDRHTLRLIDVQYDGILQVTHPDRFRSCLTDGIGSAKGFGFGLLSLAPAS